MLLFIDVGTVGNDSKDIYLWFTTSIYEIFSYIKSVIIELYWYIRLTCIQQQ